MLETFDALHPASPAGGFPDQRLGMLENILGQAFAAGSRDQPRLGESEGLQLQENVPVRIVLANQKRMVEGRMEPFADWAKSALAVVDDPAAMVELFGGEGEAKTQRIAVEKLAMTVGGPLPEGARQTPFGTVGLGGQVGHEGVPLRIPRSLTVFRPLSNPADEVP